MGTTLLARSQNLQTFADFCWVGGRKIYLSEEWEFRGKYEKLHVRDIIFPRILKCALKI